jgi:hypothetical protein
MAEERKPRKILGARAMGKRGRERPMKTWEIVIVELGKQKGKTMRYMDKLAKDRKGCSRWTEDPDTGRWQEIGGGGGGGGEEEEEDEEVEVVMLSKQLILNMLLSVK